MLSVRVSPEIRERIPDFKVGVLVYRDITVTDSPQMLEKRLVDIQEHLSDDLSDKAFTDIPGLAAWRRVFKTLGTDPARYRPSAESLYRRVKKSNKLPLIHSAADMNNYLSLKYEIPFGIYDLDRLSDPIEIRIGKNTDSYDGINGREMNMEGKLLSADEHGAFGSPIVDSKRTMTTAETVNALQLVYLQPAMERRTGEQLLDDIGDAFKEFHGGTWSAQIV